MTLEELNAKIKATEEELRNLKAQRTELIKSKSLIEEGHAFCEDGWAASERLRETNWKLYREKCREAFGVDVSYKRINRCYHRQKWETKRIQACYHATHGKEKYAVHLTDEELVYAKIYAKAYVQEWIDFWSDERGNEQ